MIVLPDFIPEKEEEIAAFERLCASSGFTITAVPGDGHCLFHALEMCGHGNYRDLRKVAADEIQKDAGRYIPFLADDPHQHHSGDETTDLTVYCDGVRREKYGGDLEVCALSNALHVRINVYESTGLRQAFVPEGGSNFPLVQLSFHKHLCNAPHFQLISIK